MTQQQVAALIALRRGGEPGRRLIILIGSVMVSVADGLDVTEQDRSDILRGARVLIDRREALAGNAAA